MLNGKYKLLGSEELNWICDFCHKKELSVVHVVEDVETGAVLRFGSVCIKKALKIGRVEFNNEVRTIQEDKYQFYRKMEMKIFPLIEERIELARKNHTRLIDDEVWKALCLRSRRISARSTRERKRFQKMA